jgi:hypothetical protein
VADLSVKNAPKACMALAIADSALSEDQALLLLLESNLTPSVPSWLIPQFKITFRLYTPVSVA